MHAIVAGILPSALAERSTLLLSKRNLSWPFQHKASSFLKNLHLCLNKNLFFLGGRVDRETAHSELLSQHIHLIPSHIYQRLCPIILLMESWSWDISVKKATFLFKAVVGITFFS